MWPLGEPRGWVCVTNEKGGHVKQSCLRLLSKAFSIQTVAMWNGILANCRSIKLGYVIRILYTTFWSVLWCLTIKGGNESCFFVLFFGTENPRKNQLGHQEWGQKIAIYRQKNINWTKAERLSWKNNQKLKKKELKKTWVSQQVATSPLSTQLLRILPSQPHLPVRWGKLNQN